SWAKLCRPLHLGGLGFRDFAIFNQALLAKQCWRILQNPDLLLSRVLKSVYFPSETILTASGRARPSWGWKSIIHGRDLLLRGLRWQVGCGHLIDPCIDNWLPNPSLLKPRLCRSTPYLGPPTVSGFIRNGVWNGPLLRYWFTPESVSSIMSIPLPLSQVHDRIIWHFTPSGEYSSSSGFALGLSLNEDRSILSASPYDDEIWATVWSLKVQPKLRFFLWRLLHRALPTINALNTRDLRLPPLCPVCHLEDETVEHLLFGCFVSRRFYALTNLQPIPYETSHMCLAWRHILQTSPLLGPVWVVAWWRIWKSRNHVVFNATQFRIHVMFRQFSHHAAELSLVQHCSSLVPRSSPLRAPVPSEWVAPLRDRLKINVDGAVRAGVGGGTGWVLRDSSGSILNAIGTPYPGISDPQVLELLALRDACLWCLRFNVLQVDIEGDAETTFSLLSSSRVWASSGGAIVDEILLLHRQVPSFRFCLVRRSGNRAAHSVARLALDFLPGNLSVVLSPWVEP
ncbi:Putative ribonuclease H protein At1g65750, partial [Linum perenne]